MIYSPLQFWHTKYASQYLPHIAIQGHEDVLFLDGRPARDLWGGFGNQETVVAAQFAAINTAVAESVQELVYDGVFLDRAERMMMARVQLEYMIKEHSNYIALNQGAASTSLRLNSLPFNHPTCDMMIALRRASRLGVGIDSTAQSDLLYPVRIGDAAGQFKTPIKWNDFSGGLQGGTGERTVAIRGLQMRINNYERLGVCEPVGHYYSEVHTSQKVVGRTLDTFAAYYFFGIYGMGPSPSGTMNFSAIDQLDITITREPNSMSLYLNNGGAVPSTPYLPASIALEAADVFVFTRNVNVLKFVSGMLGKAYAN